MQRRCCASCGNAPKGVGGCAADHSRIDQVFQFEHHTIRGQAKVETRVTLALVVMLAMALGRIRANQADLMRSLTAPVRRIG